VLATHRIQATRVHNKVTGKEERKEGCGKVQGTGQWARKGITQSAAITIHTIQGNNLQ